jgi:hypothetical protein
MLADTKMQPTAQQFDIQYDRSGRAYQVVDLETGATVETFPAKQKGDAFRFAIEFFAPDLFAIAVDRCEKYPQQERMIWKAAGLVANGAVEVVPGPTDSVYAMVESSDGMGRYAVTHVGGEMACNCAAFTEGLAPYTETGRVCSHLLAYFFHLATREDRF